MPFFRLRIAKKNFEKKIFFLKKFKFLNDPTSFLNDPDLFGQYSLVIVFLSSCFHLIPKIRAIFWAVFKIFCFKSAKIAILSCIIEWSWNFKNSWKLGILIFLHAVFGKSSQIFQIFTINYYHYYICHHFLSKSKKHNFFAIFEWSWIFRKNRAQSLSSIYQVVTWCQKSEKSLEPFSRKSADRQTD